MSSTSEPSSLLSVRETARRLGVHENTVRNWVRDGLLRSSRVPGSRFHRFDSREVERLQAKRGDVVASLTLGRMTVGPELIDASQLHAWAATRDAESAFPELVRRLLAGTRGLSNISVRTGDGVRLPGWDGVANSMGTTFLPPGSLFLEFGVGQNPKGKADDDYLKRIGSNTTGEPLTSATFVFLTPRRWAASKSWATKRRSEELFADVVVLDADDIHGWLQSAPAVHYWISEHLGRRPRDAETLERWWTRFHESTEPPLPASLFLAGRDKEKEQIISFLDQPDPGELTVQAPGQREAIAFAAAAVAERNMGSDTPAQAIVVSTSDVWDRIVVEPGQMTLVPVFDNADISAARNNGHKVILPAGKDHLVRGTRIELPRPNRSLASEALESVGIPSSRANRLAALARRSMSSLIRALARDPRIARPSWSQSPLASTMAPLVLLGTWSLDGPDLEIVTRLLGHDWPTIERTLLASEMTEDPPFIRSANVWRLTSPEEALLLLHGSLTTAELKRWHEIAAEVLLESDPQLVLSGQERIIANVNGVSRRYSKTLREGLAQGIALLSSLEDEQKLADSSTGREEAAKLVFGILKCASEDSSGRIWQSLSGILPLLAESAPDQFLDAVHDDLDSETPLLRSMFQDTADQDTWLNSSSPHTSLLWALEGLGWSADYMGSASRALARLQTVDPGGRLSNRPIASLNNIFVGWVRHTSAPLSLRVGALEYICRTTPNVGWQLLMGIWPKDHSTSFPPHMPLYKDWGPSSHKVQISEWLEYTKHVVRIAIDVAGTDVERWATLAEQISPLPEDERGNILDRLEDVASSDYLSADDQLSLWNRLHGEVAKHERFPNAGWSLKGSSMDRLRSIASKLEPTANVQRFAYLFDWRPNIPGTDPTEQPKAYDDKLQALQKEAVIQVLKAGETEAVRELADRCRRPERIGNTLADLGVDYLTSVLLGWLDAENAKISSVAMSWAHRMVIIRGINWVFEVLRHPAMQVPSRRIAIALQAPGAPEFWDRLEETDALLSKAYWERIDPWSLGEENPSRATTEFLSHRRPWAAIAFAGGSLSRFKAETGAPPLSTVLVEEMLDMALRSGSLDYRSQMTGYELGALLDHLETMNAPADSLARYEFGFFSLLEDHRHPRALYRVLERNSKNFVDLVSRVYRGVNEPSRKLDEAEQAYAHHAWWVLNHWHGFPGRQDDGSIDTPQFGRWISEARLAFAENGRADIGDEQIGQVLAFAPTGADGNWPAEAVRDLIENAGSVNIETGIHIGVMNKRGVTSRGLYDGGQQERELAASYREWAKSIISRWPRTSRVLRRVADDYDIQARRNDEQAEKLGDSEF